MEQINGSKQRIRKDVSSMVFGKIQPQVIEIEKAVLGAIMLEARAFEIVSEVLTENAFYLDSHQHIFGAMKNLSQRNQPIDFLTVVEELRRMEQLELVGGPFYITKLSDGIVSSAHLEIHARIVLEKFIQRELVRIGNEIITDAYDETTDVFDLLDSSEEKLMGLASNYLKTDYNHISTSLTNVVKRIEHLKTVDSDITGITSGYPKLDSITHGWQDTDLIILAARPSTGKTAFALNLARNACRYGNKAVAVFSLEMSADQLTQRMLSAESNVWLKYIKTGKLNDYQTKMLHEKGVNSLFKAPVYIDDTAALTVMELRAKARRMKTKHNVGLIIIDYMQLMHGDKSDRRTNNREQEISKISRELKALAKTLSIPIIALSQLSREVEKRGSKMPQLSDLRESGAIEQDADMVMFLYRPSKEDMKRDPDLKNKGQLSIAKHRNGELAEIGFNVNNSVQVWKEEDFIFGGEVQDFEQEESKDLF